MRLTPILVKGLRGCLDFFPSRMNSYQTLRQVILFPFRRDSNRSIDAHGNRQRRVIARRILLLWLGTFAPLQSADLDSHPNRRVSGASASAAIAAVNELMALPWQNLSRQYEQDTIGNVRRSLEGVRIAHGSGKVQELGLEWRAVVDLEEVDARIHFSSPPAFREVSTSGFGLDLPRGGWSFAVSGKLKGDAWVKELDQKIFSWSPSIPFGLRIEGFRVSARVDLDNSKGGRPMFLSASVTPRLTVGGHGAIPVAVPVSFQVVVESGKLFLRGRIASLGLDLGPLDAKFTGDLTITFQPKTRAMDIEVGERVDWHIETQTIEIALRGSLSIVSRKSDERNPFGIAWKQASPLSTRSRRCSICFTCSSRSLALGVRIAPVAALLRRPRTSTLPDPRRRSKRPSSRICRGAESCRSMIPSIA